MSSPITLTLSQLPAPLTQTERSGILAGHLGMLPQRRLAIPRDWPSPISRFLAPSNPKPAPRRHWPSARRGVPGPVAA